MSYRPQTQKSSRREKKSNVIHKKSRRDRLKPLSFYGHDPKHVIKAFMQVDPEELKRLEEEDRKEPTEAEEEATEKP